jgi:hypothetical protein
MPDFEICVRERDRIYCWDDDTGEVVEFTMRTIPITECPAHIASRLVSVAKGRK